MSDNKKIEMVCTPYDGDYNSDENRKYREFENRIEKFVLSKLKGYCPVSHNKNKVIHDPVWGTMLFYPWELQILDSPLLQRLRNINQVGLAILTYPSARHSRFEHTLGVMSVVTKMVDNINHTRRNINSIEPEQRIITNEDLYKIRLSALLHDVGHCFFSHLSETIYGNMQVFKDLKDSFEIFEDAKEHEIFAYLIVNSNSFKEFFMEKIDYPSKSSLDVKDFFNDIGKMIVGAFLDSNNDGVYPVKKYYMTQIINGQFDADKLDYLRRDSYTAGLALTYDIERLLYKIKIQENKEKDLDGNDIIGKHLTMPITGISAIEEMVFSQLMLTSYIYQHQKVLATDALILDVVEGLSTNEKMSHPCDFLQYCDEDIYRIWNDSEDEDFKTNISNKILSISSPKTLSDMVRRVKNRELPKRALIINYNTVEEISDDSGILLSKTKYKVTDIADKLRRISEIRQGICEEAKKISNILTEDEGGKKYIDYYDIHIVIPKTSVAKDLANAFVLSNENELIKLSQVVRLNDWADAFSFHKWNAYVFSRADISPIVSIASKVVFERNGLKFNEKKIFSNLKESKKINKMMKVLNDKYQYF